MNIKRLNFLHFGIAIVITFVAGLAGLRASEERDRLVTRVLPIINGTEIDPNESGFVRIRGGGGSCSGTLLTNEWVLTARHCLSGKLDNYQVVMGNQFKRVTQIIPHPNVDIALIRLQDPFMMDNSRTNYQQKIYSGNISDVVDKFVTCYGYGLSQNLSEGPFWNSGTVHNLNGKELVYNMPSGRSAGEYRPGGFGNSVDTIVGMAHRFGNHMHIWYKDGKVSYDLNKPFSTPENPDTGRVGKYLLPEGKKPDDIVGIDMDSLQQVWVWYKDGTISSGRSDQLDRKVYFGIDEGTIKAETLPELIKMDVKFASPTNIDPLIKSLLPQANFIVKKNGNSIVKYSLPEGMNPENIVEIAISGSRVYTWYDNGTVSAGTIMHLDFYSKPTTYALPPSKTPNGIVGISIDKISGNVLAWFRTEFKFRGTETLMSANLQVKSYPYYIGKGLFLLEMNDIDQDTAKGDSGGSCIYTNESGEKNILSVHSGGPIVLANEEHSGSLEVSSTVFREWVSHHLNADNKGSILTKGDFDNDGLDDFVVGNPGSGFRRSNDLSGHMQVHLSSNKFRLQRIDQSGLGNNENGDRFSKSFAVGDFNNDGFDDLAVGAPGESPGNDPQSGYVFIFEGTSEGLKPWYGLSQAGFGANEADDLFGQALAAGDFNNDGYDDLAVGTPGEQLGSGPKSGIVFIFKGGSERLTPWHALSQAGFGTNESGDHFGATLAAGDFNDDGYEDLAVSAPGEKLGATIVPNNPETLHSSGYVFIFKGTSEKLMIWSGLQPYGRGCDRAGDLFGWSLGVGDFNSDGLEDLAVGAPGFGLPTSGEACGGDVRSGAVFLYPGSPNGPSTEWDYLTQGNLGINEQGDWFGASLATGDLNNDGVDDLVVGAPGKKASFNDPQASLVFGFSGPESGWVFAFSGTDLGSPPPARSFGMYGIGQKAPYSSTAGDWFGGSMIIIDLDENGLMDILIGAPGKNNNGWLSVYRAEDLP